MRSFTWSRAVRKSTGRSRLLAQGLHDLPAVDAGQHHVEHHEVVGVFERHVQAVRAGAREVDRVAAFAQALLQVVAGLRVVFDDEDAHG